MEGVVKWSFVISALCLAWIAVGAGAKLYLDYKYPIAPPVTSNVHPVRFHVSWNEFIKINGSKVVPAGQKVTIPIVFNEASKWQDAKVALRIRGNTTNFDWKTVVDISEIAILDGIQPSPIRIYLPITVKDEGEFSLNLLIADSEPNIATAEVGLNINVFSFEGRVAFDRTFPVHEIIKQDYQGKRLSEHKLKEEGRKLYQRYLDKYSYRR